MADHAPVVTDAERVGRVDGLDDHEQESGRDGGDASRADQSRGGDLHRVLRSCVMQESVVGYGFGAAGLESRERFRLGLVDRDQRHADVAQLLEQAMEGRLIGDRSGDARSCRRSRESGTSRRANRPSCCRGVPSGGSRTASPHGGGRSIRGARPSGSFLGPLAGDVGGSDGRGVQGGREGGDGASPFVGRAMGICQRSPTRERRPSSSPRRTAARRLFTPSFA